MEYKNYIKLKSIRRQIALGAALIVLLTVTSVKAEDTDPFQLETGHWMSFDRYKERAKAGLPPEVEQSTKDAEKSDKDQVPNSDNGHFVDGTTSGTINVPSLPVVAAPTRPLNPPLMPGMNKGFNIQVNSTEDEPAAPVAHITHIDTEPSIQLPEKNWQKATEAARNLSKGTDNGADGDEDHTPLDIRMSFLPNSNVAPVPSPELKTNHGRKPKITAPSLAAATPPEEPKKSPQELAACASIDAYKKRQLEAIESDRQTLTALQAAIAQLGLQQQLSFMTNTPANTTTQANASPASMDVAPSLARPLTKN